VGQWNRGNLASTRASVSVGHCRIFNHAGTVHRIYDFKVDLRQVLDGSLAGGRKCLPWRNQPTVIRTGDRSVSAVDTIPRGIAWTRVHDCAGNGARAGIFIAGRLLCGIRGMGACGLHRLAGGRTGIPSSAASAGGPIVGAGDIEVGAVLAGRKGAVVLIALDAATVAKIAYRTARLV
jgi:hypothetical protein